MNTLDDLDLSKRDPGGMAGRIAAMGEDAGRAFEASQRLEWKSISAPRAIILAGMGGSAISGDLLRDYAEDELPAPLLVVRDYALPAWAGPDCLFVAASYSGGTEETLSCYADARRRGIPTVALCSGGRLKELALADGIPWAGFPGGYQPRAALGWSFFTLLGAFIRLGLVGPRDREAATSGKPLQRVTDTRSIDAASTDAAKNGAGVEHRQRLGHGVHDPGNGDENASTHDDPARTVLVHQIRFNRNQPGFDEHEQGERDLDRRAPPVMLGVDRVDEQSPAVLQVGDACHGDHTDDQLYPWV